MKRLLFLFLLSNLLLAPVKAESLLKLSTTTSTDNTGLLGVLNQAFTEATDINVAVIAVGTGQALKLGANGDVDVALVHAPKAELEYVEDGYFIDRRYVMYNDFVLVGPADDPARIDSAETIIEAMQKIAQAGSRFVSRGDDSGTHKKERQLWDAADITPTGNWYVQAGQGMGAVLKIADEMSGYALTDRGTQIAFQKKMQLKLLFEGDGMLSNPYHIMAVNPEKHSHTQINMAKQYMDFVTGESGKRIIENFKVNNQQLFFTARPETK
ncbi:substrate-binding domain-containing protein [Methylophaga nitratireducenticrescens]|uniref:ABC-type tungstate transport system, periplasmic binding protein n=1 Tax=Methylophaga nitratireducenticrescens TaxID=754476 RepID=I1XGZ0_METNJ|nr:substrate-binding domain-containing protein [Methylophaga nitratireducenticrescens]AFI83659.1 tungsten ABC transporter substrate-binding protein [Methylophaga nitratireducenticrescens]AUZ83757.1 tungsten ABC transporter substrate-binding protein [Methylophaga nitratireducenticrescens]